MHFEHFEQFQTPINCADKPCYINYTCVLQKLWIHVYDNKSYGVINGVD